MKLKVYSRQLLSIAVLFFYLIPILFFASYSIGLMTRAKSWSILSFGLLMTITGSLTLIFLLYYWEETLKERFKQNKTLPLSLIEIKPLIAETPDKVTTLDSHFSHSTDQTAQIDHLTLELKSLEEKYQHLLEDSQKQSQENRELEEKNKLLAFRTEQASQDFDDYKIFSEEQLKQKAIQLSLFQQTIEEQKAELEKQEEQIQLLSVKVQDLNYEIKTLLQLHETDNLTFSVKQTASNVPENGVKITSLHGTSPASLMQEEVASCAVLTDFSEGLIKSAIEANELLKRCIQNAQKLTGANYYGIESSRYRELTSPYHTIDQRRLFDHLRNETSALIFVYSIKEQKPLFSNNQTKQLLGWNPEKFLQDFPTLIQEGHSDWKKALNSLHSNSESYTRLLMKTKNGHELLLNCHLGIVPTGLFRNHVIAVLYPT